MENEKYNIERAQEEAEELQRIIRRSPGITYGQAEEHIETNPLYLMSKKQKEEKISNLIAGGQAKDRNEAKRILEDEEVAEWRSRENPTTGLYTDYYNEILRFAFKDLLGKAIDTQEIAQKLQSQSMLKYVDKYSGYDYLVTEQNSVAIQRLNELVDYINSNWVNPEKFTGEDVKRVRGEIKKLLYGR